MRNLIATLTAWFSGLFKREAEESPTMTIKQTKKRLRRVKRYVRLYRSVVPVGTMERLKKYHGFYSRQDLRAGLREICRTDINERFPLENRANNRRAASKFARARYREMMGYLKDAA